jgi:hypothetical protein
MSRLRLQRCPALKKLGKSSESTVWTQNRDVDFILNHCDLFTMVPVPCEQPMNTIGWYTCVYHRSAHYSIVLLLQHIWQETLKKDLFFAFSLYRSRPDPYWRWKMPMFYRMSVLKVTGSELMYIQVRKYQRQYFGTQWSDSRRSSVIVLKSFIDRSIYNIIFLAKVF